MKTVYLAGPISGLSYNGCNDWREYAKSQLGKWGINGVSPMRGKEHFSLENVLSDDYGGALTCGKGITTRDRFDSTSCNAMLVNLLGATKVSIGTMIEYGWADSVRTPIITIMQEGNPHDYAIIKELTGFRVESLDEGLSVPRAILNY